MKCMVALLLPLFTACEHKELCYNHPHVASFEVVFDWTEAPDADPATMAVYFFPEDGSNPIRHEFIDRRGGTVKMPRGVYDAVCVNSDKETHRIVNSERQETFEVTTSNTRSLVGLLENKSETAPRARDAEEERNVLEPISLWSDHVERLVIHPENGQKKVVFKPKQRVKICSVVVKNVANLRHANAISASITGLSGGWLVGVDKLSEEKVTIPFGVNANSEKTILNAEFSFFGHCPETAGKHKLMIYAQMSDGNTYYFEEDVTDQFHDSSQDPTHIKIVIEKLPLPTPITGTSGLRPNVTEWGKVFIDLPMNI